MLVVSITGLSCAASTATHDGHGLQVSRGNQYLEHEHMVQARETTDSMKQEPMSMRVLPSFPRYGKAEVRNPVWKI